MENRISDEELRKMACAIGVVKDPELIARAALSFLKKVRNQTEQRVRRETLEWAAAEFEDEPDRQYVDWPKWFREAAKAVPSKRNP